MFTLNHVGISQWLTCCFDLIGFDRVLAGSWRSRKGRVDGEGRDVWRGGGKERVGQINNGILSGLCSLSRCLSFSFCLCLCVLFSAPAAFPSLFHSRTLDISQKSQLYDYMCLYMDVYVCICMQLTARKCVTSVVAERKWNPNHLGHINR